MRILNLFSL